MSWNTIVVIVCMLLATIMLWQEYQRPNRLRLPLRLIATILAALALACIALPISYNSKSTTSIKDGILLTKGFNKDSLALYQNNKLFTTETAIQKTNPKLKIILIDLAYIPQAKLNVANLHILGYGLNGDELKELNHFPIQFHPVNTPPGITTINWNHRVNAGEQLIIQGSFPETPAKTRLILKGLNTGLDSVVIPAKTRQNFQLQTTPKNTGRATYTLLAINGTDTIERETIPFEVEPTRPLNILMLATSPDFENRFLKNWLSQHGYGVTVRTAISKEKFSREYFNMEQTDIDHITPYWLQKFDVVVGDLSSFKLLSGAESSAIQQQVAQKGLGIIVKADSAGKGSSFLANAFAMDRLADKNQKSLSLNINGQNRPSAKITLDAVFIKPQPNTKPLVTDEQGHIIISSTIYGSGNIIFSTLSNSFNWALSGNQNDYSALWTMLIDKVSRKASVNQKWTILTALPVVDAPVNINTNGPLALPGQIKAVNNAITFAQNTTLPFCWNARYWPENYGWQPITQNGITVYWWYVFKNGDWVTVHASENTMATKRYAGEYSAIANAVSAQQNNLSVPVSKLYFYLLLLFCCTYLWVERKF